MIQSFRHWDTCKGNPHLVILLLFSGYPRAILAAALCAALTGCDRAPLETPGFRVELISPEASEVQLESQVDVTVRVIGRMAVDGVTIAGMPAAFDQSTGIAQVNIVLLPGRNLLEIRATNADQEQSETIELVHVPYQIARITASELPEPRSDATATLLDDGRILVAGGVSTGNQRLGNALLLSVSDFAITVDATISLQASRAGHTASLLPDGRVLLLGGTDSELGGGGAEVLDPVAETSEPVTFDGPTFNRTHHATHLLTLGGVAYLHAIGGETPSGLSGTIDILRWRPETNELEVLSPAGGTGSFPILEGASMTVADPGNPSRILLTGLSAEETTRAYGLLFEEPGTQFPFSISEFDTGQPGMPRGEASFTPIVNGTSLLAGGIDEAGNTLKSLEIATETGFFQFPDQTELHTNRSHHAATSLGDGRILIVGGRGGSGAPLSSFEMFIPR